MLTFDKENSVLYKSCINDNYNEKVLQDKFKYADFDKIKSLVFSQINGPKNVLEISHHFTPLLDYIDCDEKFFLTDDAFSAMLTYHHDSRVRAFHLPWNVSGFESFGNNDKFDLIVSFLGLNYGDTFNLMKNILTKLTVGGVFVCVVPRYWFDRSALTEQESEILQYSKQNDKKWLFLEEIGPIVEECCSSLAEFVKIDFEWVTTRRELAHSAGLTKLYNAELMGDISILETTTIAADLNIPLSSLIIKKNKTIIDKNNLFKF